MTIPSSPAERHRAVTAAFTARAQGASDADAVQRLLDGPEAATPFRHPMVGEMPLLDAVDRFYTSDVFMHTWDLARATGQDERLDSRTCAALLAEMAPIEELIRSSGQFGPQVPVPQDADVQTHLLGFIGRDPTPGTG